MSAGYLFLYLHEAKRNLWGLIPRCISTWTNRISEFFLCYSLPPHPSDFEQSVMEFDVEDGKRMRRSKQQPVNWWN